MRTWMLTVGLVLIPVLAEAGPPEPGKAITIVAHDAQAPTVASDGAVFFVVWVDSSATPSRILGQRVRASDLALLDTEPILITSGDVSEPAVASAAGEFLVVWTDGRNTGSSDVYGARVRSDGYVLDADGFPIANFVTGPASGCAVGVPAQEFSPVVAHAMHEFFVAWLDKSSTSACSLPGVLGVRVGDDGVRLDSAPIVISVGPAFEPAAASNGENFLIAMESDLRISWDILALDGSIAGGDSERGGDTTAFGTASVSSDSTDYVVAWRCDFLCPALSSDSAGIIAQTIRGTDGAMLGAPRAVDREANGDGDSAPAVRRAGGEYLIGWSHKGDVFARRFTGDPDGDSFRVFAGAAAPKISSAIGEAFVIASRGSSIIGAPVTFGGGSGGTGGGGGAGGGGDDGGGGDGGSAGPVAHVPQPEGAVQPAPANNDSSPNTLCSVATSRGVGAGALAVLALPLSLLALRRKKLVRGADA